MTTYTSTGAGDWNNAATWGGGGWPNTAGDIVNIGHNVKYNIDDDVNAMGLITITAGKLYWDSDAGTVRTLRLGNGLTLNGGELELRPGAFIRIASASGIIQMNNTASSVLDAEGTIANAYEAITTQTEIGDGYLKVADASKFGVGEYVNVFDDTNHAWTNRDDECFIVQAIDTVSNPERIYIRRFVGPSFILENDVEIGDTAWYATADVRAWKDGMKFIIGTEVLTVASIDKINYIIYTDEAAAAEHTAADIGYETGAEKVHATDNVVYKLASVVVGASSGNNYMDVVSSSGWANNDIIAIEGNSYNTCEEMTISSISVGGGSGGSDRLNFGSNLAQNHDAGNLVVKVNRDVIIHGTTADSISSTSGSIYCVSGAAANRQVWMKNVELRYVGSTASQTQCSFYDRLTNLPASGHLVQGCSIRHGYKSGQIGSFLTYGAYYHVFRNNINYDTMYGHYCETGYYIASYANIFIGNGSTYGHYFAAYAGCFAEYLIVTCTQYNTLLRYGFSYGTTYISRFRYWISNNSLSYGMYFDYQRFGLPLQKIKITNPSRCVSYFGAVAGDGSGMLLQNAVLPTALTNASYSNSAIPGNASSPHGQVVMISGRNFIPESKAMIFYFGYAEIDETILMRGRPTWKFTPQRNNADTPIGFYVIVLGQKGRTIKIGAWVRKNSTFNGTRPYVEVRHNWDFSQLAVDQMADVNDTWEYVTTSYTFLDDIPVTVYVSAYASTGNFWISEPMIDSSVCQVFFNNQQSEWRLGDPTATGLRFGGIKLYG
jgi:hypothetical protein